MRAGQGTMETKMDESWVAGDLGGRQYKDKGREEGK